MSVRGHSRRFLPIRMTFALPPKADIWRPFLDARCVSCADIPRIGYALALCQNWPMVFRTGRRMLHRLVIVATTLVSVFASERIAAQEAIGTVSRIQGEASETRGNTTRPLGLNASLILNETVSTGAAARLEVTFKDNTRLTLGENTKLTLYRYVFDPAAGRRTIRFRVVGAFRIVSGQVSKLARSDIVVTTPVATIGVRGTEFWAGPIDDQALGVLLVEGAVRVSNRAGVRILNRAGQGTNIARPGAAPGRVTSWPQDKVNRALATVTFP
jgi:hypothetical protein